MSDNNLNKNLSRYFILFKLLQLKISQYSILVNKETQDMITNSLSKQELVSLWVLISRFV